MEQLRTIDLFAGCGGMSWGLQREGFRVITAVDEWDLALETFRQNHEGARTYCTQIEELDPADVARDLGLRRGDLEVLVGGPPCQGFSKNVPASYRFLQDPRNQLFRHYLRFVDYLRPKVVVMENVAEIFRAFDGHVTEEILEELHRLGYQTEVAVLFAPDFGVPQRRRRCFFFATHGSVAPTFPRPSHGEMTQLSLLDQRRPYVSAWEAISDLPALENGGGAEPSRYDGAARNEYQVEMRHGAELLFDHVARDLKPTQLERVRALGPGQGLKDLPDHLRPAKGYSGAYGRLDFESVAGTVTRWVFHPGSGRYYHPKDDRLITIREAARLQSFHDEFRFLGSYVRKAAQVGNAVPPRLMQAFAPHIRTALGLARAA